MKKSKQPFDYDHHDLAGHASVDFAGRTDFNAFAEKLTGYNPLRFSPVALRLFMQRGEPVMTLYAVDNMNAKKNGKIPVKKFKLRMKFEELFSMIKKFDFTVSDGRYDIGDIIVTNK
jgi:hypothetical protein